MSDQSRMSWWTGAETRDRVVVLSLVQLMALSIVSLIDAGMDVPKSFGVIEWAKATSAIPWFVAVLVFLATTVWLVKTAFDVLPKPDDAGVDRQSSSDSDATKRNLELFDQFLVFLGAAMAILVLDISLVIAGLMKRGILEIPLDLAAADTVVQGGHGIVLILSCALALLGSLFFTANSLYRNRGTQTFEISGFWSGFWFRMGESVLFVLVLFLIIISGIADSADDKALAWLIPCSLLIGMFVKSGERLIFGLAERIFAMMKGMLPASEGGAAADKPGNPRNLTAKLENNQVVLAWDEPLSEAPVNGYKIYLDQKTEPELEVHATVRTATMDAGAHQTVSVKAFNSAGESGAATADWPQSQA